MAIIAAIRHPSVNALMSQTLERLRAVGHDVLAFDDFSSFERRRAEASELSILFVSSASPCSRQLLESLPSLKGLVFIGAGTGSIDLAAATQLGIPVAFGGAVQNAESMAEAAIMLMLVLLYRLGDAESRMDDRGAPVRWPLARMLKGKKIGLIGYGKITQAIISRLRAWGPHILVASRHVLAADLHEGCQLVDLRVLLSECDLVSLHAQYTSGSPPVLGAKQIAQMKAGALFINTARGGLVDEDALYYALSNGALAGAAPDTFRTEPLSAHSPLLTLSNVILTPHSVGHTLEGYESMVETALDNITRLAHGELPQHLRNPEVLPAWNKRRGFGI